MGVNASTLLPSMRLSSSIVCALPIALTCIREVSPTTRKFASLVRRDQLHLHLLQQFLHLLLSTLTALNDYEYVPITNAYFISLLLFTSAPHAPLPLFAQPHHSVHQPDKCTPPSADQIYRSAAQDTHTRRSWDRNGRLAGLEISLQKVRRLSLDSVREIQDGSL